MYVNINWGTCLTHTLRMWRHVREPWVYVECHANCQAAPRLHSSQGTHEMVTWTSCLTGNSVSSGAEEKLTDLLGRLNAIYFQVPGTWYNFNKCVFICGGCYNKVLKTRWPHRNVLPLSSGGWKSKIKGSAGLVPSQGCEGRIAPGLFPWLIDGCLLPVSLFVMFLKVYFCIQVSFFIKPFIFD